MNTITATLFPETYPRTAAGQVRDRWIARNRYYYRELTRFLRYVIPTPARRTRT